MGRDGNGNKELDAGLTRREFVAGSAATAAVTIVPASVLGRGDPPPGLLPLVRLEQRHSEVY